jgi:phosphoribosylaminoimidazole-succinocarboxamide synthase
MRRIGTAHMLAGCPRRWKRRVTKRSAARLNCVAGRPRHRGDNPGMISPALQALGAAVPSTSLHSLPLLARGKVRDNYAVGDDRILMVASDRLSAFDVVMKAPVPGKGRLLTQMALFWFKHLEGIVPHHLTGQAPESVVAPDEVAQVAGRSMLVKRLTPLPCEAVVRGYVAGSGWKEYQKSGTVCGIALPPGLQMTQPLAEPIFTPATKAAVGDHDENISFDELAAKLGAARAAEVRSTAIALYKAAAGYALSRGIVIADTKFEFGLDAEGRLTLMDEVLTPDSSRFWLADELKAGRIVALDKQPLRDWLASTGVTGGAEQAALDLPEHVILGVHERYERAYRLLCGGDE